MKRFKDFIAEATDPNKKPVDTSKLPKKKDGYSCKVRWDVKYKYSNQLISKFGAFDDHGTNSGEEDGEWKFDTYQEAEKRKELVTQMKLKDLKVDVSY